VPDPVPVTDGLWLWLRSDRHVTLDAQDLVSTWADARGRVLSAYQPISGWRPAVFTTGAPPHPSVYFDGVSNLPIHDDFLPATQQFTLFFLGRPTATRGTDLHARLLWTGNVSAPRLSVGTDGLAVSTASNQLLVQSSQPLAAFCPLTVTCTGPELLVFLQGIGIGSASTASGPLTTGGILGGGSETSLGFIGHVTEVLLYDRALGTSERRAVEAYLQARYDCLPQESSSSGSSSSSAPSSASSAGASASSGAPPNSSSSAEPSSASSESSSSSSGESSSSGSSESSSSSSSESSSSSSEEGMTSSSAPLSATFDSDDYSRGFDPISGDPWTSVCQSPTLTDLPGMINLNVNDHIRVLFTDNDAAQRCEIAVADGDSDKITVETVGGMQQKTVLRITGYVSDGAQQARVHVYDKDKPTSSRQPLATLRVDVLPAAILNLGIWMVQDSTTRPETLILASIDQPRRDAILQRVNKAFGQAGVVFQPVSATHLPAGPWLDIQYDKLIPRALLGDIPPNDMLNFENTIPGDIWVECLAVQEGVRAAAPAYANLALVRRMDDPKLGITIPLGTSISYLQTSDLEGAQAPKYVEFEFACAHEVGHQFNLSTRNTYSHHDDGPYPTDLNGKVWKALMAETLDEHTTEWMRREDWSKANMIAQGKTDNWTPLPNPL
jgi:hypothetical protein